MDNKGFISIESLFSLFFILIIALGVIFYASSSIQSSINIENDINHRLILDNAADVITQVNSNGAGYSKSLYLDSSIGYYQIKVDKDKLTMEYNNKKGETAIPLVNFDSKYTLNSGRIYLITKEDDGKVVIK